MIIYIFTYLALLATGLTISAGVSYTSSQQKECIIISTTAGGRRTHFVSTAIAVVERREKETNTPCESVYCTAAVDKKAME